MRDRDMKQLKVPTTYAEQMEILQQRNVQIEDETRCEEILRAINYYRITAYLLPFKLPDGKYEEGTRFSAAYQLYEFDRKLRNALFSALEEIEIYLRSRFAYFHVHKYGAEGYTEESNYSAQYRAERFSENLKREIESNQRALFVKHHIEEYGGHFPLWAAVELFSFGMLSRFYSDLKTPDQKELARELYGSNPKNVKSWLHCCTDLRNICAHYGRLYYRVFSSIPANVNADSNSEKRLWGAVLALYELYPYKEKWNTEHLPKLEALFEEYKNDISLYHIGFPENWIDELEK